MIGVGEKAPDRCRDYDPEGEKKTCILCQRSLTLDAFWKDWRRKDGIGMRCTECHQAFQRLVKARWREANRERAKEQNRRWIAENPAKARESQQRWREANREKYRAIARHADHLRRSARKQTDLTQADSEAILAGRTMCPLCRKKMTEDPGPRQKNLDHIVPLGVGGTHTAANVRVICRTCNISRPKDGRDLDGYQPALWSVAPTRGDGPVPDGETGRRP